MAGDGVTLTSGSVDCYVKFSVKLMGHKGKKRDIKLFSTRRKTYIPIYSYKFTTKEDKKLFTTSNQFSDRKQSLKIPVQVL